MSDAFSVISGVRRGIFLSARFWAVYMDDLIIKLRKSSMGCHIINYFVACILYADDVCLSTPGCKSMQYLLNTLMNKIFGSNIIFQNYINYRRNYISRKAAQNQTEIISKSNKFQPEKKRENQTAVEIY